MLARGELQTVGATTLDEYRKHLEKDAALERRFQPVKVDQPSVALHHRDPEGPEGPLRVAPCGHHHRPGAGGGGQPGRPLHRRPVPAGQGHRPHRRGRQPPAHPSDDHPADYKKLEEEIARLRSDKEAAIEKQAFEQAKKLAEQEKERLDAQGGHGGRVARRGVDLFDVVDEEVIAEVLANWTGIPVYRLTEEETAKLLRMEDELHKRVIGQEPAIPALSRAIRRTRAGLKDPKRPSGSFIFLGPTGVGKTELAKTLAEFLFDDEDALIQLDMSEYMEKHTVSRWSARPRATSATRRAVSSPRRCGASRSRWSSSTRSRRRTPTCSTPCCRSWRTVA